MAGSGRLRGNGRVSCTYPQGMHKRGWLIFMISTSQVEGNQKKLAAGDILPTVKMNAA